MAEGEESEGLYCLCRRPYQESEFMIECDVCKDWFHGSCVGIEEHQSTDIDLYHCPNCQPEHGPLTLKRRRNWHRHDYSEINDGKKAIQSGTVVFVKNLKKKRFPKADGEVLFHVKGSEVNTDYFEKHGFTHPLLVEEKEGLGIKVPPLDFTVADVERCVGSMRELDVIDVSRQDDLRMKMREWTEYYEDRRSRNKVLNVISLEFTGTDLAKLVSPPSLVRKIDWINNHWPDLLPDDSLLSRPLVQKYCLMGVQDSYTDFHVDFGGTSVWYHVLRGEKVFYLIPPTEENLLRYEDWVMSSDQSEIFFGDLTPKCYVATIAAGNTLFIPTGWIHAVLTPVDSLVFGGNFLHRYNIRLQLRIYEMERRLKTPLKFRHPCYEALTWFAARNYLQEVKDKVDGGTMVAPYLLDGLKEMQYCFTEWTKSKEETKLHREQVPHDVRPSHLLEQIVRISKLASSKAQQLPVLSSLDRRRRGVAGPRGGRSKLTSPPVAPGRKADSREKKAEPQTDRKPVKVESGVDKAESEARRRSITMRLATSESRVIKQSKDKKVALKLRVPEAKVVETSIKEEEEEKMDEEMEAESGSGGSVQDETSESDTEEEEEEEEGAGPRDEDDPDWSEYKDNDYVYPDLVAEEEMSDGGEGAGGGARKRKGEDHMWTPGGKVPMTTIGGLTPRGQRNAKKRSFEHSLSATAAKILKLEEERNIQKKSASPSAVAAAAVLTAMSQPVNKKPPLEPVAGGGALQVNGPPDGRRNSIADTEEKIQRARAAAAASAVSAVVAASRPKSKLLTPKQRLGKILGLGKNNRRKL